MQRLEPVKDSVPKIYPNNVDDEADVAETLPPTKGIVIDVSPEHPAKADEPIVTTESGTTIANRPEQL